MRSILSALLLTLACCGPALAQAMYSELPEACRLGLEQEDPQQGLGLLLQCREDGDFDLLDGEQQDQVVTEIGFAFARLGRFEEALDEFDRLVYVQDSLGSGGTAHHDRGLVYRAAGYHDLALADFSAAIMAAPTADDYLQRGVTYEALGQQELALPDYATALDLEPDNDRAGNCLAWIMATSPNPELLDGEAALALAHQVVARTPNSTHVDTLAAALARAGHYAKAVQTQELALDMARQEGGQPDYLAELQGRLDLYRQNQPFTDQ